MRLVDKIKARFPKPKRLVGDARYIVDQVVDSLKPNDDYCVGGAFISYTNGNIPFPGEGTLANHLMRNNPLLSADQAFDYANDITLANDDGDFDAAWDTLESALSATT